MGMVAPRAPVGGLVTYVLYIVWLHDKYIDFNSYCLFRNCDDIDANQKFCHKK